MNSFGSKFGGSSSNPNPQAQSPVTLNFLEPRFIRGFKVPDGCCLIGDYHFIRGDFIILAGPPGVGKSRAAVAAAVCGASISSWFGFPVHQKFKTLIFQNENGLLRLHVEIDEIGHCIDDSLLILEPPEKGLAFSDPGFRSAAGKAIAAFKPDLIIIDPWNAVAASEKQKDIAEAFNNIRAVIPQSINNPAILVVAHTRKPRVDERSCGRSLLNIVAGSYMLGSVPRSVFVLQHASDKVDEDRVVMTCCKNNNGLLGPRGAWKRNGGGVFDEIEHFDWQKFDSAGKYDKEIWRDLPAILLEIGNCPKNAFVAELCRRFKISSPTAYRWIEKAAAIRSIRFDNHSQSYYVPQQS